MALLGPLTTGASSPRFAFSRAWKAKHDTNVSNKLRPNPDCTGRRRLHGRFDKRHSNNPVRDSRKINLTWNRLARIDCTDRRCNVSVDIGKAFEITLGVPG